MVSNLLGQGQAGSEGEGGGGGVKPGLGKAGHSPKP